ncbi:hypothetical protein L6164_005209 [Bauhinia variegata]|uniref:Uncharacterized protein n=1 Tax=Bauhinia variegata TaxID=167791 RepID=A0ACB9PQL7_BAUVA|nr:hypothetical protein L6164_005209 [Bauhinia variegata]
MENGKLGFKGFVYFQKIAATSTVTLTLAHSPLTFPSCRSIAPFAPALISPSTPGLGWIGTGVMGQSMCLHLIRAGYKLTVFNRTLSKAEALVDMGAQIAQSPLAVVFSIFGYPSDVRSVLLDPNSGALSGVDSSGVLVDMITSEPSLAVEIASAAASKGCHSIETRIEY